MSHIAAHSSQEIDLGASFATTATAEGCAAWPAGAGDEARHERVGFGPFVTDEVEFGSFVIEIGCIQVVLHGRG